MTYDFPRTLAAARSIPNVRPPQSLPPLHCSARSCEAVGSRNFNNIAPPLPRWRFNFPLYWSLGGHSASLIAHYVSGLENDNAVGPDGRLAAMPAQVTFDLQYVTARSALTSSESRGSDAEFVLWLIGHSEVVAAAAKAPLAQLVSSGWVDKYECGALVSCV